MSDEQKDLIVGRLVRERAEAKREFALMRTELERIEKAIRSLHAGLEFNVDPGFHAEALRKVIVDGRVAGLTLSEILDFAVRYEQQAASLRAMATRLRELGIE